MKGLVLVMKGCKLQHVTSAFGTLWACYIVVQVPWTWRVSITLNRRLIIHRCHRCAVRLVLVVKLCHEVLRIAATYQNVTVAAVWHILFIVYNYIRLPRCLSSSHPALATCY